MLDPRTWTMPPDLDTAVSAALREWTKERKVERLWARDANLWTGGSEASWLGWLEIVDEQLRRVDELRRVAEDVRQAGFTHALLLGMGGSSLCPEVLRMTFGALPGWPELSVLDSTDPAQVRAAQRYGFGVVKAAQARGDFEVLAERGRRALRVHLGADVAAGLRSLGRAVEQAIG
jgi:transaldolase / glucose-6-phosphate isomerase